MSPESSPLEREAIRHVLRDRAFRASHPHGPVGPEGKPLLTFQLGGEVYAIEARRVREVVAAETPCRIPGADRSLRGVVNVRGSLVTVIDTFCLLDLPRDDEAVYLLVLELPERPFALEIAPPIDLATLDEKALAVLGDSSDDGSCHRPIVLGGKLVGWISPERLLARVPRAGDGSHRSEERGNA